MLETSRRDVILSAAVASAALGLDKCLAIVPAKKAQTPDPNPGFHKYKVGDAEVVALYDGIWEKPHDSKYFGNATTEDVKEALAQAGLPTGFVSIPITVYAIRLNGKLVLCDAGGGDHVQAFRPNAVFVSGKMAANMKAAGIRHQDVDTILVSHFHPDHIFGLMGKTTNAPVFPNAEIIVPSTEYKWWTDPSLIGRLPEWRRPLARRIQSVIPGWKNVLPVDGEDEVVPGIRFVKCPGHTAGHTAFLLSAGSEQLMLSNDAAYVPALLMRHPQWHGVFDQDGPMAEASRRKLLDRVDLRRSLSLPGLNRISKDGDTYALTALAA